MSSSTPTGTTVSGAAIPAQVTLPRSWNAFLNRHSNFFMTDAGIITVAVFILLYMALPYIVAKVRHIGDERQLIVIILGVFLGFTGLPWLAAMAVALFSPNLKKLQKQQERQLRQQARQARRQLHPRRTAVPVVRPQRRSGADIITRVPCPKEGGFPSRAPPWPAGLAETRRGRPGSEIPICGDARGPGRAL